MGLTSLHHAEAELENGSRQIAAQPDFIGAVDGDLSRVAWVGALLDHHTFVDGNRHCREKGRKSSHHLTNRTTNQPTRRLANRHPLLHRGLGERGRAQGAITRVVSGKCFGTLSHLKGDVSVRKERGLLASPGISRGKRSGIQ